MNNLGPLGSSLSSTNSAPFFLKQCELLQSANWGDRIQKVRESEASPVLFLCSLDSCSLRTLLCCTSDKSVEPINSLAGTEQPPLSVSFHRARISFCARSHTLHSVVCLQSQLRKVQKNYC